jgi:hypothetical protein
MRRFVLSPVSVLLLTVGSLACCTSGGTLTPSSGGPPISTPCDNQPRDHRIYVTSKSVSCRDAYLSKGNYNVIEWFSDKGTQLSIQFQDNPFVAQPFCSNNKCIAFDIREDVSYDHLYAYDFSLNGQKRAADPNVIIKP